jgi:hypothetical protein
MGAHARTGMKKSSGKRNPFLRFLNVRPIDGIMKTA